MTNEKLSFAVPVRDVPIGGRAYRIEADEGERRGLAETLGIPDVTAFAADLEVRPAAGSAYSVRGELRATVVQTDVVTLDPVSQEVVEEIAVVLMPAEGRGRSEPVLVDVGEEDAPDVFRNGRIDLGAIVTEHLALGLDPYPRAPETEFPGYVEDDPAADPSPFAGLAVLKKDAT